MSRIGNAAVVVPNGVDVTIAGLSLTVKGPKGTLSRVFPTGVSIAREKTPLWLLATTKSAIHVHVTVWFARWLTT